MNFNLVRFVVSSPSGDKNFNGSIFLGFINTLDLTTFYNILLHEFSKDPFCCISAPSPHNNLFKKKFRRRYLDEEKFRYRWRKDRDWQSFLYGFSLGYDFEDYIEISFKNRNLCRFYDYYVKKILLLLENNDFYDICISRPTSDAGITLRTLSGICCYTIVRILQ